MAGDLPSSELAALDAEVANLKVNSIRLEKQVGELSQSMSSKFDELGKKIDAKTTPNYLVPLSMAAVLVAFLIGLSNFMISPLNNAVAGVNVKLDTLSTRFVDRETMATTLRATGERRDEWQAASMERDKTLSASIEKLRDGAVTWQAHEELRRYFQAQADQNRNEISDLRTRVGDTFGLRDALQMIGKRLDSLEQGKGR